MASPQLVSGHAVGYAISWPIRALVGVDPMVIVIGANSVLANAFGWSTGITICAGAFSTGGWPIRGDGRHFYSLPHIFGGAYSLHAHKLLGSSQRLGSPPSTWWAFLLPWWCSGFLK